MTFITFVAAYVSSTTENIVAIDYRKVAGSFYLIGVMDVGSVGKAIAGVLDQMVARGLNPNKIHIVGHSMGGQVSGYVGKYVTHKIARITGMYKFTHLDRIVG